MIKSITVTNYVGDKLDIILSDPLTSGFIIKSIEGLGPSKGNIHTSEVSTTDGSMFNSARINQRNIVIEFQFVDDVYITGETVEDIRHKSYRYFPVKKRVDLLIETDNRLVTIYGYTESNEPDIFSEHEGCQISIICPDPYFYSAGENGNTETVFYGLNSMFEFPFSNESITEPLINFGEIQNKTENTIKYYGDSEVGVTMYIHAMKKAENITIYNISTREKMVINTDRLKKLIGTVILPNDDIIINTTKGNKSIVLIRNGETYNILNCLDRDTAWFMLRQGDNIFSFTAETGVADLQFKILNRTVYEGV